MRKEGAASDPLVEKAETLASAALWMARLFLPTFYADYAPTGLQEKLAEKVDEEGGLPDWDFFVAVGSVYVAMMVLPHVHPDRVGDLVDVPFQTKPSRVEDEMAQRWLADAEQAFRHCSWYVERMTSDPMPQDLLMQKQAASLGLWALGNTLGTSPSDLPVDARSAQALGTHMLQFSATWQ